MARAARNPRQALQCTRDPPRRFSMDTARPDPNAELHSREPLRIVFALTALVLGLLTALHG